MNDKPLCTIAAMLMQGLYETHAIQRKICLDDRMVRVWRIDAASWRSLARKDK